MRQAIGVRSRWAFVALAVTVGLWMLRAAQAQADVPWPEPCGPPCHVGR